MTVWDVPTKSKLLLTLPILQASQGVEGYLYDEEVDLLVAAASHALTRLKEPSEVVEIGSYLGKSTIILGLVAKTICPDVKVYAIDPHEGELSVGDSTVQDAPTFETFMHNIARFGLRNVVVPVKEYSFKVRWQDPISFLFIDGLHDYHSVARDFSHFAPWVVPGGYVAFHDYGKSDFPGVTAFVEEVIDYGYWQPVQRAAGLIVLEKPASRGQLLTLLLSFLRSWSRPRRWPHQTSRDERRPHVGTEKWDVGQRTGSRSDSESGRIQEIMINNVDSGAAVLAVGLEEDLPPGLTDRYSFRPFPATEDATHSARLADDAALIAELEARRAEGADYLLVNGDAVSWLEAHPGLHRYLDSTHFRIADTGDPILYELYPMHPGRWQVPGRVGPQASNFAGGFPILATTLAWRVSSIFSRVAARRHPSSRSGICTFRRSGEDRRRDQDEFRSA